MEKEEKKKRRNEEKKREEKKKKRKKGRKINRLPIERGMASMSNEDVTGDILRRLSGD